MTTRISKQGDNAIFQGIAEMLYENQPHFSLVSNGAEVIMVEKKFYLENASQRLMVQLRESVCSYIRTVSTYKHNS